MDDLPQADRPKLTELKVPEVLQMLDLGMNSLMLLWKFSATLIAALFGGVILQSKQVAEADLGMRVVLCFAVWAIFVGLWAATRKTRGRVEAAFVVFRRTMAGVASMDGELIERMAGKTVLSEHLILVFALLFTIAVFWGELKQLL